MDQLLNDYKMTQTFILRNKIHQLFEIKFEIFIIICN